MLDQSQRAEPCACYFEQLKAAPRGLSVSESCVSCLGPVQLLRCIYDQG